jgi:hypothetical protein
MFLDELDHAIDRIGDDPAQFSEYTSGTRRMAPRGFPTSLFFGKLAAAWKSSLWPTGVAARAIGGIALNNLNFKLCLKKVCSVARRKEQGSGISATAVALSKQCLSEVICAGWPWRNIESAAMLQSGYITGYTEQSAMSTTSQTRALNRYRKRLNQRGMARFEVLGLDADRELIRSLAKRLAGDGPDSARIRATVRLTISEKPLKKGGILNALRRSPLVGADLDLNRPLTPGRRADL